MAAKQAAPSVILYVRIPPELDERLRTEAKRKGVSMVKLVVGKLESST